MRFCRSRQSLVRCPEVGWRPVVSWDSLVAICSRSEKHISNRKFAFRSRSPHSASHLHSTCSFNFPSPSPKPNLQQFMGPELLAALFWSSVLRVAVVSVVKFFIDRLQLWVVLRYSSFFTLFFVCTLGAVSVSVWFLSLCLCGCCLCLELGTCGLDRQVSRILRAFLGLHTCWSSIQEVKERKQGPAIPRSIWSTGVGGIGRAYITAMRSEEIPKRKGRWPQKEKVDELDPQDPKVHIPINSCAVGYHLKLKFKQRSVILSAIAFYLSLLSEEAPSPPAKSLHCATRICCKREAIFSNPFFTVQAKVELFSCDSSL